ncbi:MAG: LPS export ABC transporter periplasmic protein LptC [Candidatus Omnitrophota bacterium]|nr:LPS export ABC transporter periplasmic protein LptC [Candidatus Omnitrophota bacterium]
MAQRIIYVIIFLGFSLSSICIAEEKKEAAQQEVKDFSFVQYKEGGAEKWKLNGRSAEVLDNRVDIEYMSALSFGEGTMLKLKANKGIFDKGDNMVHLSDNVVAASTDGTKLTTDHMVWDADTKNVSTDGRVSIKRPDMEITGTGAVCDIEGKTAELKQDINARLVSDEPGIPGSVNGKDYTTITCDGPLELNYNQNRAFFHGNVKVEDSKGNIMADRIDVYFNPETRRVKLVVARGNVRIINGENITYSEKAIYFVDQARVILPSRPKLVIKNDGTK